MVELEQTSRGVNMCIVNMDFEVESELGCYSLIPSSNLLSVLLNQDTQLYWSLLSVLIHRLPVYSSKSKKKIKVFYNSGGRRNLIIK